MSLNQQNIKNTSKDDIHKTLEQLEQEKQELEQKAKPLIDYLAKFDYKDLINEQFKDTNSTDQRG